MSAWTVGDEQPKHYSWLDPTAAEQLRAERDEAIGEKDAAIRNWIGVQDAWERTLPVVEAAKAWRDYVRAWDKRQRAESTRPIELDSIPRALAAAVDALEEET